jgi:D-sedoheptulose 7-phosphate isomerase
MLAKKGDILFCISSSGKSKNILNAAKEAQKKNCFLITLSGFSKANPLKKLGNVNFYVPAKSYGYVEIAHLAICHCIVDTIIKNRKSNG